jgi:uncharacterized DUF497 family protein
MVRYEWDEEKDALNRRKHGVSFRQAQALLGSDVPSLTLYDEEHSMNEDRFITIGPARGTPLLVVWAERSEDDVIRIISARLATRREARLYKEYLESSHE